MRDAEDCEHAAAAACRFDAEFGARWPKAADEVRDDSDRPVAFHDCLAEHRLRLKTANPIESTSTVRLQTMVTQGPSSRAAGLALPTR